MNQHETDEDPRVPTHFRRLESNELVSLGDFVANENNQFELWEGPRGFLADSFIRPIYRKDESHSTMIKK